MNLPPGLMHAIDALLTEAPAGLSEYELIQALDRHHPDLFPKPNLSDPLLLFQHHFVLMHVLYRLQQDSHQSDRRLSISPLRVQWQAAVSDASQSVSVNPSLAAYYLDFGNLTKEDGFSVEQLLQGFWRRLLGEQGAPDALATLGLKSTATFADVKSRYRQLANTHHPDKGGDSAEFGRIQEAYDTLKSQRKFNS
ncbi:DNA-J related domain-containing protein [Saccharospirillum impatiens]|uniref:DNA-J related domain-containing protein n=1 Tax=Saccharospirillum impatiens TaxID=169438 RepID=UPI00146A19C5|nr:DNA-J related domain-containing protein [Saccharospirillum impatiens]